MDVMFSKLARAYLESPRTFMRVDVDDHGPPLEFARELDLLDELDSYLNSPKQLELLLDSPDSSPIINSPIIDILPPLSSFRFHIQLTQRGKLSMETRPAHSRCPYLPMQTSLLTPHPPTSSLTTASTTANT